MLAQTTEHMFRFTFEKSSAEIKKAAEGKIKQITAKIREREERVAKLRKEYRITDVALIDLLRKAREASRHHDAPMSYSYTSNVAQRTKGLNEETVTIGAGVVNNILTENDFIDSERAQVKQLQTMVRNLRDLPDPKITTLTKGVARPMRGHALSYEELDFLGF